jgi:6-phosphofructokinase 1
MPGEEEGGLMEKRKRIAILTGGGDCPGTNAVIRAVTKKAILEYGMEVIGIEDGYDGLVHDRHRTLEYNDVSGIIALGGTILGTTNRVNPYRCASRDGSEPEFKDVSETAIRNANALDIACLVCIGGDGTLGIASRLDRDGIPIIGVPKTIDNDVRGTDTTFGFDSALSVATEGIDRIRTTAESHHRAMIVEVMGRNAGWIALHAGTASGGDIVLIPEIPFDYEVIAERVKERHGKGKRFSIVVAAEGAKPKGGEVAVRRVVRGTPDPIRLGGIGFVVGARIEELTGIETRTVVMGHLQRGGSPTAFDRVLATRLGAKAVDMIESERFGHMVGVRGSSLVEVPLDEVAGGARTVPVDSELMETAHAVGTCFGH